MERVVGNNYIFLRTLQKYSRCPLSQNIILCSPNFLCEFFTDHASSYSLRISLSFSYPRHSIPVSFVVILSLLILLKWPNHLNRLSSIVSIILCSILIFSNFQAYNVLLSSFTCCPPAKLHICGQ